MKTRIVALALALVMVLAMATSAFALPDNYKHYCPEEFFNPSTGAIEKYTKSERNPFSNLSEAYCFAKFVPDTCSIWVYGKYALDVVDDEGNVIDEVGGLKHLAVFKYTEDKKVIEMVAYEHAFKCFQKGAELPITEAGRYFAAVCDIFGAYKTYGRDFKITEDMLPVVEEEIVEEEIEVLE